MVWPFSTAKEPEYEDDSDFDERLLKVERRVKELELENGILRNKVLRKIQTRYPEEAPAVRKRRSRRLYGGRRSVEDDYDEEEDYDDG